MAGREAQAYRLVASSSLIMKWVGAPCLSGLLLIAAATVFWIVTKWIWPRGQSLNSCPS